MRGTIQNAEWSKVYINDSSSIDPCRKCRRPIKVGEPYQFVGGWNTAIVWCARCSPIIKRHPESVEEARARMLTYTCSNGHVTRLNGRQPQFCFTCHEGLAALVKGG